MKNRHSDICSHCEHIILEFEVRTQRDKLFQGEWSDWRGVALGTNGSVSALFTRTDVTIVTLTYKDRAYQYRRYQNPEDYPPREDDNNCSSKCGCSSSTGAY